MEFGSRRFMTRHRRRIGTETLFVDHSLIEQRCAQAAEMPAPRPERLRSSDLKREVADLVDRLVAERIRERRIALGITQQMLADYIGIAAQQVHKHERGDSRVTAGRLAQIAEAIDVPIGYFFEPRRGLARAPMARRQSERAKPLHELG
jgi:DNA-binding XRE family transcriptional regulator